MIEKFEEIVEFALEREYEAAEFYRKLGALVLQPASKGFLKELEDMENEHASALRKYLNDEHDPGPGQHLLPDLKIGDKMETLEPHPDMTFQEVIIFAIKAEVAAANLYDELAESCEGLASSALFKRLALEEMRHKSILESMYDEEIYLEN